MKRVLQKVRSLKQPTAAPICPNAECAREKKNLDAGVYASGVLQQIADREANDLRQNLLTQKAEMSGLNDIFIVKNSRIDSLKNDLEASQVRLSEEVNLRNVLHE